MNKRKFLWLSIFATVLMVGCLGVFTACDEPMSVDPTETTNSVTTEESTTDQDSASNTITVSGKTFTIPDLPECVGEDVFAGKIFQTEISTMTWNGESVEDYTQWVFDPSNKTVKNVRFHGDVTWVVIEADYSYDEAHVYMRTTKQLWAFSEPEELLELQNFVNLYAEYLSDHPQWTSLENMAAELLSIQTYIYDATAGTINGTYIDENGDEQIDNYPYTLVTE